MNIDNDKVKLDIKGKEIILEEIDSVVIAAGSKPYNPLQIPLEKTGIPVRIVGDSFEVTNGLKGIYAGYMAGYEI